MGPVVVLEDALRLKSGRLGTEDGAGVVGLVSDLVGAEELMVEGRKVWFATGAGEPLREAFGRFCISAGGAVSADT